MEHIESVGFRLLVMPCCDHQISWVNPRLPNFCPECGSPIYRRIKDAVYEGEAVIKVDLSSPKNRKAGELDDR